MAFLGLHSNSTRHFLFSPLPSSSTRNHSLCRSSFVRFAVFSSHSNQKLLKSNRRSRYGRRISPYDDDDEDDDEEEEEEELSDDDLSDLEEYHGDNLSDKKQLKFNLKKSNKRSGNQRLLKDGWEGRASDTAYGLKFAGLPADVDDASNKPNSRDCWSTVGRSSKVESMGLDSKGKLKNDSFSRSRFQKLQEEHDFDEKWFPLIDYLGTFGLKESHFISIYERHMPCLQINLTSAEERLEFLLSVGVKNKDMRRILVRQPQILEYTVKNLKSHIGFLVSIGIPNSRLGQIIASAPSLFSYSVEQSLKPTIRYLIEEVGIKEKDVSKVVQLSPQILVQRIDSSWTSRYFFLSRELGAPKDSVVKMVTKHPQLLHYSIEDGILPRINFLRSIGMSNSEILKVLTSLTQVLSLSLEGNLKPKYLYLVNELRNEVQSLTKYPMYLSLSLEQRIRPRHRFLVSLKKAPKGPFPLSSLVPTDESFCQQWAGTSLEKYLQFRQGLLLTDFAKKYERKSLTSSSR
ncbi:transcription termination factor MTERF9, chloroplastic [Typha latifolia]|uniref:transcription termination factor MTERF9, chloroplastic n=1 Tax=Typha latifolia TaxID=4733 RepID=UPI003C2CE417